MGNGGRLLHLYSPSRSLRSASETRIFRVSRMCRRTLGERSFQCVGRVIWNSLPFSVTHATSLSSVKSKLKPTSSLLPTDLSLSFFCFRQTHDYYVCVFAVCLCVCVFVCVCVCVYVRGGGMGGYVCVYLCVCVCVRACRVCAF